MKKIEKLYDVNSLLGELHEKWPNATLIETKADYSETEREGVSGQNIKMIFKFNLESSYPSIIEFSHLFSIDATSVRILLEQKEAQLRLGSKDDIEAFFENCYFKITGALYCFNGIKDDYEAIVDLMIKARGQTIGEGFGL